MYLWNVNALVKDLREDKVSEKEKLKYYLFSGIFALALPKSVNLFTILDIGVFIIGIYLCFEVSSKGDNRNFIERMICLGVPLQIRFLLAFFALALILAIFINHKSDIFDLLLKILDILLGIIYYLLLRSYIEKVSQPELPIQENNISAN